METVAGRDSILIISIFLNAKQLDILKIAPAILAKAKAMLHLARLRPEPAPSRGRLVTNKGSDTPPSGSAFATTI